MIHGIGCDIVNHERTKELNWETDVPFQKRVFSALELSMYSSNSAIKFLAGRFAVKEAVLKCLGTGMEDGIALTEIEVFSIAGGKPEIKLYGKVKKISEIKGINKWHVTISHGIDNSVAYVIAEVI